MIQFGQSICQNLELASRREWLETNGIGGYASSTITGLNRRRYHGLLVAATKPPVGWMVLLSKLEETLIVDGRRFELSANRYPGVVHPKGYEYLKQFRRAPFPISVYEVEELELETSIFMAHGENTVVIEYCLRGSEAPRSRTCILELRPLIAFRDYHNLTHENGSLNPTFKIKPEWVRCSPYSGCPGLYLAYTSGEVQPDGVWYRNFEYTVEQQRGFDFHEDLFNRLVLTMDLQAGGRAAIIASTEHAITAGSIAETVERLRAEEIRRRKDTEGYLPSDDPFTKILVQAADQFLVRRGSGTTVIAGYHWFTVGAGIR